MKRIAEVSILLILLAVAALVGRNKLAVFYCNQGIGYHNRALYKEAIASFKKSLSVDASSAFVHNNLALAYIETGQVEEAIEAYKRILKIEPKNLDAYLGLGKVYRQRRLFQEALDALKQAEVYFPANQDVQKLSSDILVEYTSDCLNKGTEAFLAQDKQKAFDLVNKAVRIKPDYAHPYYTLAFFYYSEQKYGEAQDNLNKAIEIDPRFWPAYKLFGDIYMETGDYQGAFSRYNTALNLAGDNASLYNNLGLAFMEMERYKEAAGYLSRALMLDPDNLDTRYSLASVYKDAEMFDNAVPEYKKVIARKPDYPNVHNDLADSYVARGNNAEAAAEYRKEIEQSLRRISLNPDDAVTLNNLAHAYCGIGELKKAQEVIKKAILIQPDYRDAYITLSKIQEKSGDTAGATVSLNKAKSLSKQAHFIDRQLVKLKKEQTQNLKLKAEASFFPTHAIYLKNGRKLFGVIKSETNEKITIEMAVGDSVGLMSINRGDIERIAGIAE